MKNILTYFVLLVFISGTVIGFINFITDNPVKTGLAQGIEEEEDEKTGKTKQNNFKNTTDPFDYSIYFLDDANKKRINRDHFKQDEILIGIIIPPPDCELNSSNRF